MLSANEILKNINYFGNNEDGSIRLIVKNTSGERLERGKAVYVSSLNENQDVQVLPTQPNNNNTILCAGLLSETVENNEFCEIVSYGDFFNISTSGYSLNDKLYADPTSLGGLTNIMSSESSMQSIVGYVKVVSEENGVIIVDSPLR